MVNIITADCYLLLINKTLVSKINKMVVHKKHLADHNHTTKRVYRIKIEIVKLFMRSLSQAPDSQVPDLV